MKKIKLLACFLFMISLLTGCTKGTEYEEPSSISGGWEVATTTKYEKDIDKKALSAFDKAIEEYTGLTLDPFALIGTQVVSGTNYMFIARGTTVTQEPVSGWKIVTIYEDLKGNAEVKDVNDFEFSEYTSESIQFETEELSGGWSVNSKVSTTTLDEELKETYEQAINEYTDVKLDRILYLGSQVVSGTNYAFLDVATTMTQDSKSYIAVVTVYKDLEGNSTVTNVSYVDLVKLIQ